MCAASPPSPPPACSRQETASSTSAFADFSSASAGGGSRGNLTDFYTEQKLHWSPRVDWPLDLYTQLDLSSCAVCDVWVSGVRWRVDDTPLLREGMDKAGLTLHLGFNPLIFDLNARSVANPTTALVEVWYRIAPGKLGEHLSLNGLADLNLRTSGPPVIVTEHQLEAHLSGPLFAVAELRYSEVMPSGVRPLGLGLGLQLTTAFHPLD